MEKMGNSLNNNSENSKKSIINKIRDKTSMVAKGVALFTAMNTANEIKASKNEVSGKHSTENYIGSEFKNKLSPIIVHDINDPRLKEYQDSLNSYNNYPSLKKYLFGLPDTLDINYDEFMNLLNQAYKEHSVNGSMVDIDSTNKELEKSPIKKIIVNKDGVPYQINLVNEIYKKPIQEVIYSPIGVKWFRLANAGNMVRPDLPVGTEVILVDNKYMTIDEFEEYKKNNPDYKYVQLPDSIGRTYKSKN